MMCKLWFFVVNLWWDLWLTWCLSTVIESGGKYATFFNYFFVLGVIFFGATILVRFAIC